MKHLQFMIMMLVMSYSILTHGQGSQTDIEQKEASKVADKFFQGLSLLDLPEGKEMLNGLTFEQGAEYPVISSNSNIGLAKAGVSCFYDSEVLNSSLMDLMKFSAVNPRLRKAAKR
jgi:hypothetical protein